MTINVAVVTYDGIILGCDSLSSMVEGVLMPYRGRGTFVLDDNSQPIVDDDGHWLVKFKPGDTEQLVTTVFGGVSKMFCLYEDDDTSVAAVTSGLATLAGVTIAEQAKRFRRRLKTEGATFESVGEVALKFQEYIQSIWLQDREKAALPESLFPDLQFIVAGHGKADLYGKVFRVNASDRGPPIEQFQDDDHVGICWGGTADYVERLLRGADGVLMLRVTRELARAMRQQRESTLNDISMALTQAGVQLPDDLDVQVREEQQPTLPWDSVVADIDFGNLSTQYAVEFVELLVNIQSGMQRFARGIPVVGGRTHIGVLKRGERFDMLNEPTLLHKHTGYSDDF